MRDLCPLRHCSLGFFYLEFSKIQMTLRRLLRVAFTMWQYNSFPLIKVGEKKNLCNLHVAVL